MEMSRVRPWNITSSQLDSVVSSGSLSWFIAINSGFCKTKTAIHDIIISIKDSILFIIVNLYASYSDMVRSHNNVVSSPHVASKYGGSSRSEMLS